MFTDVMCWGIVLCSSLEILAALKHFPILSSVVVGEEANVQIRGMCVINNWTNCCSIICAKGHLFLEYCRVCLQNVNNTVQGSRIRLVCGLVNFVPALA